MQFKQIICYFADNMKTSFYISLLLYCVIGFASCTGPVILEEENPSNTEIGNGQDKDAQEQDSVAIIHEGTFTSPYSIAEAQTLGRGKEVWIEGYIVGAVSGSMKNGCQYETPITIASNILLADTFPTGNENDYLHCMPVQLPDGLEREELNLYDNPDNYHQKLRIQGDITLYYKVAGIKNIEAYTFGNENEEEDEDDGGNENEDEDENEDDGDNEGEEEDKPHDSDATYTDTLSIAEGIKLQSDSEYNQVYIKGYIIGYTTSNRKIYYDLTDIKETSARSNVVLADDVKEDSTKNMIAVELANGSYIQQAINLVDNPENLHRILTVKGVMKEYKSLYGCIDIPNGLKQGNDTIKDYFFRIE